MRFFAIITFMLLSFTTSDQLADGKVIIEFNAGFNTQNGYKDLGRISGAKLYRIDIEAKPGLKNKYKIKSVPTLIYFNEGEEQYRWQAGIDMKLHIHYSEIQDVVNRY